MKRQTDGRMRGMLGGWMERWVTEGQDGIHSSSDILVSRGEPKSPTSLSGASQEPVSSFQTCSLEAVKSQTLW